MLQRRMPNCQDIMSLTLVFCFFTLLLHTASSQDTIPDEVKDLIDKQEAIVDRLAEEVAELFENRARYIANCRCSNHACSSDIDDFECTEDLGNDYGTCGDSCEGRMINFDGSAFRTPPGTDIDNMDARLKESICLYRNLEPVMKELLTGEARTWLYFGGIDGMMRIYPVAARKRGVDNGDVKLGDCSRYDPRLRPWFIGASTRPKDIVFVIDISGSMNDPIDFLSEESRWDVTKRDLFAMLDSLSDVDYVNIVTFSDVATRLGKNTSLLRALPENKAFLKDELENQSPSGTTNFDAGFSEAFDVLTNACDENPEDGGGCSNCHKVIFFLTDGRDTSLKNGESIAASTILNKIERYQRTLARASLGRANIFTFSMGESSDDSIPRQVACANSGSWSFISSETDALSALNSYYHFLTDSSTSNTTTWIAPYEDAGGLGQLTTVSRPVFSKGTEDLDGVFLGVASHDVLLTEIQTDRTPFTEVLREIINRAERCGQTPQTQCQLQVNRNANSANSVCVDPITSISFSSSNDGSEDEILCYRGPGKFYKFFPEKSDWESAFEQCDEDDGRLVVIEDEEELEYVAGLSSPDGSWIGAKINLRSFEMEWIDDKVSADTLNKTSPYWGVGEPNNLKKREDCVHIDRRGIIGNLNDARCETKLSFICEYENGFNCEDFIDFPEQGYFRIPPISQCANEEELVVNSGPLEESEDLTTKEIMCSFGKEKDSFEVTCCPDCKRPRNKKN